VKEGDMKDELSIPKGKYRHYKGNLYEVLDIARHSETLEDMVVYRALYGDFGIWVRPLKMFMSNIEIGGITQKRFEFMRGECKSGSIKKLGVIKGKIKILKNFDDELPI
jgi:hypothetical protein